MKHQTNYRKLIVRVIELYLHECTSSCVRHPVSVIQIHASGYLVDAEKTRAVQKESFLLVVMLEQAVKVAGLLILTTQTARKVQHIDH